MRIQLASDLHLEFLFKAAMREPTIAPALDADLLVLAGDVANGTSAIEHFHDWPVPVLYVAGNHEFYGRSWERTRVELRQAASGTKVVFLDNDVADLTGFGAWSTTHAAELERLRFLGATLWTDYRLRTGRSQRQNMTAAEHALNDHHVILTQQGSFRARDALEDHETSRAWLARELAGPFEGKTVVVTHHGPHPLSVHPRFQQPPTMALNAAFVSDLAAELRRADLWLHGHVHDSFDYRVGQCRVLANPRGYPLNRDEGCAVSALRFENAAFDDALVATV